MKISPDKKVPNVNTFVFKLIPSAIKDICDRTLSPFL